MKRDRRAEMRRKLDEILDSIDKAAEKPTGLERRIEELAREFGMDLMEEGTAAREERLGDEPPDECPDCGGDSFRQVKGPAPEEEGGGKK